MTRKNSFTEGLSCKFDGSSHKVTGIGATKDEKHLIHSYKGEKIMNETENKDYTITYWYSMWTESYSVTGIDNKKATEINIPSTYDDGENGEHPVTSIDTMAFWDCSSLKSITISEGVTSIGEEAFADCHSLENVDLPETLTSIGKHAFWSCGSLKELTIPENVRSINEGAFAGCRELRNVTFRKTEDWFVTDAEPESNEPDESEYAFVADVTNPEDSAWELISDFAGFNWRRTVRISTQAE